MTRRSFSFQGWLVPLSLWAAACGGEHGHEQRGHAEAAPDELPGQSVTVWAARTELFMEHKPLIVGRETGFAAHVTEMPSFGAVTAGSVTLTVKSANGAPLVGRVDAPTSPGIFRPQITPTVAGPCTMEMEVKGAQLTERFEVGPCEIFADEAAARKALGAEEEPAGRISFLKEQQWKTEFATAPVAPLPLQPELRAVGEIRAVPGREVRITATASGRLQFLEAAPVIGTKVEAGQLLATIALRGTMGRDAPTLDADVLVARADLDAAQAQLGRAQRLLAEGAGTQRAVEEASARVKVARAALGGASGRQNQFRAATAGTQRDGDANLVRLEIRAPIAGTLVAVEVASGQSVEEGAALFTVIDLSRIWIVAQVFEPDIPAIAQSMTARFQVEGYREPFVIDASNGRRVTVGHVVDPETRTVDVIFERDNPEERLRIGQFVKVAMAVDAPRNVLAIPESAIIDEAGRPIAYVMVEGESFERRPLGLGIRAGGQVEVLAGLAAGEHVVTVGGYEIKLTAASGIIPAHGHAH